MVRTRRGTETSEEEMEALPSVSRPKRPRFSGRARPETSTPTPALTPLHRPLPVASLPAVDEIRRLLNEQSLQQQKALQQQQQLGQQQLNEHLQAEMAQFREDRLLAREREQERRQQDLDALRQQLQRDFLRQKNEILERVQSLAPGTRPLASTSSPGPSHQVFPRETRSVSISGENNLPQSLREAGQSVAAAPASARTARNPFGDSRTDERAGPGGVASASGEPLTDRCPDVGASPHVHGRPCTTGGPIASGMDLPHRFGSLLDPPRLRASASGGGTFTLDREGLRSIIADATGEVFRNLSSVPVAPLQLLNTPDLSGQSQQPGTTLASSRVTPFVDALGNYSRSSSTVRPSSYDGSTPWAIYERQFLMVAELNKWNPAERAATLTAALRGAASGVLGSLTDTDARDFDKICTALRVRFGEEHLAKLYFTQFDNRCQNKGEDLATLGHDLERLARSALPDCPDRSRDQITCAKFINAITDPALKHSLRMAAPTTLRDAIVKGLEIEVMTKESLGPQRIRQVKAPQSSSSDAKHPLPSSTDHREKAPTSSRPSDSRRHRPRDPAETRGENNRSSRMCSFCKRRGHEVQYCFALKRLLETMNQSSTEDRASWRDQPQKQSEQSRPVSAGSPRRSAPSNRQNRPSGSKN